MRGHHNVLVALGILVAACGDGTGPEGSPSLARIEVFPEDLSAVASGIVAGETHQFEATLFDSAGQDLPSRPVSWRSSEPGIATVDIDGVVTALAAGRARITAEIGTTVGGYFVDVIAAAASLEFLPARLGLVPGGTYDLVVIFRDESGAQLSAIGRHLTWTNSDPQVASGSDGIAIKVTGLSDGTTTLTASGSGATASTEVDVATVRFSDLRAGNRYTCGVSLADVPYCWGTNVQNVLGASIGGGSDAPLRVEGIGPVNGVYAGLGSTCAIELTGDTWCWGWGAGGQLGDGSSDPTVNGILPPRKVVGGIQFASLAMGYSFSCGLAVGGEAHCWGYGGAGSLGNGATGNVPTPSPVAGGLTFVQLSTDASGRSVCGLTAAGEGWCWGANAEGQLGDGTTTQRNVPVEVTGNLEFTTISVGSTHACGLSAAGVAYCWGGNYFGQLGQAAASLVPSPVDGGLTFRSISAGPSFTCGITTTGAGYCWGYNGVGQLGNGSETDTSTPTPVTGGLTFSQLSAGADHVCGLTEGQLVYCWGYGVAQPPAVLTTVPVKVVGQE